MDNIRGLPNDNLEMLQFVWHPRISTILVTHYDSPLPLDILALLALYMPIFMPR